MLPIIPLSHSSQSLLGVGQGQGRKAGRGQLAHRRPFVSSQRNSGFILKLQVEGFEAAGAERVRFGLGTSSSAVVEKVAWSRVWLKTRRPVWMLLE